MVHGSSPATITGRWLGKTPFVQVSMTRALTCLETVRQRPCVMREIETWLSDSRVGNNSVFDHRMLQTMWIGVEPTAETFQTFVVFTLLLLHTFNYPFSGTTQVSWYQKGKKPIWILLKQETVSGSGISWAICKSAPRSRHNHSSTPSVRFLQAGCPSCCPTNSVKTLKAK